MSPSPSIENRPLWILGNTSFPGRDNLCASLDTPPMCNLRAITPTGFSADWVAT